MMGADFLQQAVHGGQHGPVLVRICAGSGDRAIAVLGDHRQGALRQIAQIVGQIGVDAGDEGLVGIIAVLAEGHLAQEEVAHLIDAVMVDDGEGIDDVADGLRHLLAPVEQKAVAIDAARQLHARRHQEGRPVDGVKADDVLADDVHIRRPVFHPGRVLVREAAGGEIVGQGVHPDIHDMARRVRHRHAPVEGGARDGEILQAGLDEGDHLVAPLPWADELRMGLVMGQQLVLISREAEEIALLLHPLHLRAGGGEFPAVPFGQLVLAEIGLVAHRIPAGILVQIDVAIGRHAPPELLDGFLVALLGGADEVIVGAVERPDHGLKFRRHFIDELFGRLALFLGRLDDLLAVFVHPGEEHNVITVQPLEAGQRVGGQGLVGVADVRRAIGIGNGGGDIELALAHGGALRM